MQFQIPIQMNSPEVPVSYHDRILLVGSCFTEHIGNALEEMKFPVMQNPHGILFDPESVCESLKAYADNRQYKAEDLFELNEVWHSWQHHSRFSNTDRDAAVQGINTSVQAAHDFLKSATCVIITLGSSFTYRLTEQADRALLPEGAGVANCHRAPAQWFSKQMHSTERIHAMLKDCCDRLLAFNPGLRFIFTVSPVRHIRDGVVANNRSKARLIEAIHQLVETDKRFYYFPAYELVVDVLRDYRFYDIDLVHPNFAATSFVLEKFTEACMDKATGELMEEIRKIVISRKHKPFQAETQAHRSFLATQLQRATALQQQYPFIDLSEEINFFKQSS